MKVTRSKWDIYRVLKENKELRPYLPKTRLFSKQNVDTFLNRYHKVILKPIHGRLGYGVIKLSMLPKGKYKLEFEDYYAVLPTKHQMHKALIEKIGKEKYIIQQYIPLAKINKQPIDIRVMLQRSATPEWTIWTITGKAAKIASPGYVITNSATKVLPVKEAIMRSNIKKKTPNKTTSEINRVSLRTVEQLFSYSTKNYSAIGLDIGVDKKGNIWIIEANLKPNTSLFRLLKNPKIYKRIKAYKQKWKQYKKSRV